MNAKQEGFLLITIERTQLREHNGAANKSSMFEWGELKRTKRKAKREKKNTITKLETENKRQHQVAFVQMLNAKRKQKHKKSTEKNPDHSEYVCCVFRAFDSLMIIEC